MFREVYCSASKPGTVIADNLIRHTTRPIQIIQKTSDLLIKNREGSELANPLTEVIIDGIEQPEAPAVVQLVRDRSIHQRIYLAIDMDTLRGLQRCIMGAQRNSRLGIIFIDQGG